MSAAFVRKYNTAATLDGICLRTAGSAAIRANPTLAAGDVKILLDGGAFANLTTLPSAVPATGKNIEVALSAAEMSCHRALIIFADQTSPAEWDDFEIIVETFGNAAAQFPPDYSDAVRQGMTALPGAGTLAVNPTLAAAQAFNNTGTWTGSLTGSVGTIGGQTLANLDAAVSSRMATFAYVAPDNATIVAIAGYVDTEVAAIKTVTDRLATMIVLSGAAYVYTAPALVNAPIGGGSSITIDNDAIEVTG